METQAQANAMETQAPVPPQANAMETQAPVSPQANASPSRSYSAMAIVNLVLRAFVFLLLLIALIILTTASMTVAVEYFGYIYTTTIEFNDYYAYRYTLYTIVIGMIYALLQTAFAIFHLATGKLPGSVSVLIQFDFYADKFISYTLATGAAAAFGMTVEAKRISRESSFWDKTSASASILLLGFICSAVSSIFSSFALSKSR